MRKMMKMRIQRRKYQERIGGEVTTKEEGRKRSDCLLRV